MKSLKTLLTASTSIALATAAAASAATPPGNANCTMTRPIILDMTVTGPMACEAGDVRCLVDKNERLGRALKLGLPSACQKNIDVYVPGTNAEDGSWKQFNHMFSKVNGRGHVVIKYSQATLLDAGAYDQSTADAFKSLSQALMVIKSELDPEDVDVFGHSKGSHAVALAAQHKSSKVNYAQFFAFAQPGRTAVDMDGNGPMKAAKLGKAGYIHKIRDNLVGITFSNDEVYEYKGLGTSGLVMPESWAFPGNINTTRATGTVNPAAIRIDHHNNYGGLYTDGVQGNDPMAGQGTVKAGFPYCATGSKKSLKITEWWGCSKRAYTYVPWFWGNAECEAAAYRVMNSDVGKKVKIGASGPRGRGCSEGKQEIKASFRVKYKINVPDDKDCDYRLRMKIQSPDGKTHITKFFDKTFDKSTSGSWKYNVSEAEFKAYKRSDGIPGNFRIRFDAEMLEDEGWGDCQGVTTARALIRYVKVRYKHPVTGKEVVEFIVRGGEEGDSYLLQRITGDENVAWKRAKSGKSKDTWDLYWDKSDRALKISGMANDGQHGAFYKQVYLFD
ncbi:MAG: hypothetical protein HRU11_02605 [Parvularculaceae bacterium]|nr:hypothetical protein [Parvularculaceae bacterium]